MATKDNINSWKHPNELIQLQRKKQLAARLNRSNNRKIKETLTTTDKASLLEAKIAQKRKNPFAKQSDVTKKIKTKDDDYSVIEEDSILDLIQAFPTKEQTFVPNTPPPLPPTFTVKPFDGACFKKLLKVQSAVAFGAYPHEEQDDSTLLIQKITTHLPMDWSIKTRVRFFSPDELPATTLKTTQLASGLTSFVRCMDTRPEAGGCNSLDISPATRFSQATYHWQHPHLPWLTLFPRNSKENVNHPPLGDLESKALAQDWDVSFRGLFQLLRARQCPYFYLCANSFTVLFRAAGTGGIVETHALMSPTSRGMRSALRQEGIEFSMPLKKDVTIATNVLNKSADSAFSEESNSLSTVGDITLKGEPSFQAGQQEDVAEDGEDGEDEEEAWLDSLGVDGKEIRRMQSIHSRKIKAQEMAEDFSDNSLLLIEGVECQGFFSFLLNAKSLITTVGRLAGVPPTLLSPVAFPLATMQQLSTRSNKVRMEGVDYYSCEARGVVLPTFLPHICRLLGETRDVFSATLVSSNTTLAFSKATQKLLEHPRPLSSACEAAEKSSVTPDEAGQVVFGQENLSDCGLQPAIIEDMCRTGPMGAALLERVCHDRSYGYAWS